MKKIIILSILCVALLTSGCSPQKEIAFATLSLSIREKPDDKAKKISYLRKGEKVYRIKSSKKENSDWVQVKRIDGDTKKIGYIRNKYLAQKMFIFLNDSLTLFSRANLRYESEKQSKKLRKGTVVFTTQEEVNEDGEWVYIRGGESQIHGYLLAWMLKDSTFNLKFSDDPSLILNSLKAEDLIKNFKKSPSKHLEELREIARKPNVVGDYAVEFLKSQNIPIDPEPSLPNDSQEQKVPIDTNISPE